VKLPTCLLTLTEKMRIDAYLFENGYTQSRTEAKSLILEGAVRVCDRVILKPSYDVSGNEHITVDTSLKKYVSRGGLKLEEALNVFKINPKDKLAIDIGASSGGFTDCLLKHGALHVISLDAGVGQLHQSLRQNSAVTVIENYNARYINPEDFEYTPSLAVMDVSFISATYIIPGIYNVLSDSADFICLIKPQFEVGRESLGKGGIVRDELARKRAIKKVCDCALACGFKIISVIKSPITGGDGNVEYLAHLKKTEEK